MVELKEIGENSAELAAGTSKVVGIPESGSEENSAESDDERNSFMDSEIDFEDENDGLDDSDRELQIAFQKGYLKPGLNIVQPVIKKSWINNASGLKAKLDEFKKDFDWIERLDVTVDRPRDSEKSADNENDFKREVSFIKQAQNAVSEALPRFKKLNILTKRPDDYFAEMFKNDDHMKKVRQKLVTLQQMKEKSEAARRFREEKKFAAKIQKDVALERQKEKKMLSEAVKKHKKGIKDQLENIIGDGSNNKKKNNKRALKDQKYGHGGQKKRSKWNTSQSFNDVSEFEASKFSRSSRPSGQGFKNRGQKSGPKNHKKQRPGKQRRINMKNKKKNRR